MTELQTTLLNRLYGMIQMNDLLGISDLLSHYPDLANTPFNDGSAPLSDATINNNPEIVELLLNYGANPNGIERNDYTPLFWAITGNYSAIIELLLKAGANPNVTDSDDYTPFFRAIMLNNPEIVELLLAHGADVNMENNHFETPLSLYFANSSNLEIVKLLINHGAEFEDAVTFKNVLNICFNNLYAQENKGLINAILQKCDLDKILDFFDEDTKYLKFDEDTKYSNIQKHDLLKMFFNNLNLDFPSINECQNELRQSQNNPKVLSEAMQDLDPDITKALLYEFDHNFYHVNKLTMEQLIHTVASSKLPQAITTVLQNTDQNIDPATSGILSNTEHTTLDLAGDINDIDY